MEFDKNGRKILKVLNTDKWVMTIYHVPEYLAGKLNLPIDIVQYQLNLMEKENLIHWNPVEDGRSVEVDAAAYSAYTFQHEKSVKETFQQIQIWVWPIIVVIISELIKRKLPF